MLKRINYSWVICITGALLVFCSAGLTYTGFSPYQPYLISVKGLTNFQCSTISTIRTMVGLFSMSVVSRLMDRFGLRRVCTCGMLFCTAAFLTFGLTSSYAGACAGAVLAGCAYGLGGMIPASILISRWFNTHNGLALGIVMAATGLSAFIGSPIITWTINHVSLRAAFVGEALFVLAMSIVVYAILRSRPSCIGLEPLGASHSEHLEKVSRRGTTSYAPVTVPPSMIWGMGFLVLAFGIPANNLTTNISLLFKSEGMDAGYVGWIISLFGMAVALGKCVYGMISDRIGMIPSTIFMYALVLLGSGLCIFGNANPTLALVSALFMGFGLAVTTVSNSTYALHISTDEDYPRIVSRFQLMNTIGGLLFSTVPGIIADKTGSYVPAFVIMFIFAAVSSVSLLLLFSRCQRWIEQNAA